LFFVSFVDVPEDTEDRRKSDRLELGDCLEQSAISLCGLPCGDMRQRNRSKFLNDFSRNAGGIPFVSEKVSDVTFCHILATIMGDNRNHRSGNAKAAGEPNRENSLVSCHGTCVILSIPG
jgi:hypothetical protein